MRQQKLKAFSKVLNREFHLDLFTAGGFPRFLILFFGGSGVSWDTYTARSSSVNPVFNDKLAELEKEFDFVFAYISSPPDVRISDFERLADEKSRWAHHLKTDILPVLPDLPFFLIGYSGGIALALSEIHETGKCVGAGALGGDQIAEKFNKPMAWKEPLTLYYNQSDPVYQVNQSVIQELVSRGDAHCFRKLPGTHALQDYIRNESFSGMIRRAGRLMQNL